MHETLNVNIVLECTDNIDPSGEGLGSSRVQLLKWRTLDSFGDIGIVGQSGKITRATKASAV
jgi:hypothetical protein